MTARIVAARFETDSEAKRAIAALKEAGFADEALSYFYVTPPGQHAMYAIGGDAHHDEGTREAAQGAAAGGLAGAAAGVAIAAASVAVPAVGVAAALGSVGAGAWIGSMAGAMGKSEAGDPDQATAEEPVSRKAGEMVAARVDTPELYDRARRALDAVGATEVEEAQGTLENGDWSDFDPRLPPRLLAPHGGAANTDR